MNLSNEDKKILTDYLNSEKLMSIATFDEHPWIASVYYVTDDDLSLYFVSPEDAMHSQAIKNNEKVACAIADSSQGAEVKKVGLQIYGHAKQVNDLAKIKWMLDMYNKLYPSTKEKLNFKNFEAKIMTSKVYKITPVKMKMFNQKLFAPPEKLFSYEI